MEAQQPIINAESTGTRSPALDVSSYHNKDARILVDKKDANRFLPIVVAFLATALMLLAYVYVSGSAAPSREISPPDTGRVISHIRLGIYAREGKNTADSAFSQESVQKVWEAAHTSFVKEMKERAEDASRESKREFNRLVSERIAVMDDVTPDLREEYQGELFAQPYFAPGEDSNQILSSYYEEVVRVAPKYGKDVLGKRALGSSSQKNNIEKLGCALVLQSKYPGFNCVVNLSDTPVDTFAKDVLTAWYSAIHQNESVEEYCENFFEQIEPNLVSGLKKDSSFLVSQGKIRKCPTPFGPEEQKEVADTEPKGNNVRI